jgi:hypothetical protein
VSLEMKQILRIYARVICATLGQSFLGVNKKTQAMVDFTKKPIRDREDGRGCAGSAARPTDSKSRRFR